MTETATFTDVLSRAEELMDGEQYEEALGLLAGAREGVAQEPSQEADLHHYLGVCLANLGRPLEAAASYRRGLARAEVAGEEGKQARAHEHLGSNLQARQDGEKALSHYEKALRLYQKLGDRAGEARSHRSLGNTYVDLNNRAAAVKSYGEARPLFREAGDEAGLALCIANSTMLVYQNEGAAAAIRVFRESLEREACRHYLVLNNFGFLLFMEGELEEAESILAEARDDVAKREVEDDDAALVLLNAGNVLALRGRLEEAESLLRRAADLFERFPAGRAIEAALVPNTVHPDQGLEPVLFLDNALKRAVAHCNLGAVLALTGRPEEGQGEVEAAAELDREQAYPWYVLGWVHLGRGDVEAAATCFKRARGMAPNVEDVRRALELANPYAGARVGRNDPCPCGSGKKYKKCHGR